MCVCARVCDVRTPGEREFRVLFFPHVLYTCEVYLYTYSIVQNRTAGMAEEPSACARLRFSDCVRPKIAFARTGSLTDTLTHQDLMCAAHACVLDVWAAVDVSIYIMQARCVCELLALANARSFN